MKISLSLSTAALLLLAGCDVFTPNDVPDQSRFLPLDAAAANDAALVRVYGETIFPIDLIALHVSFVVKPMGVSAFELWELQPGFNGPLGHVLVQPSSTADGLGLARRDAFVIAELAGPEAEPVADFIRTQSPLYPCRFAYELFGPNSNTYIQWVLTQTNWNVVLSPRAIGKDAAPNCP